MSCPDTTDARLSVLQRPPTQRNLAPERVPGTSERTDQAPIAAPRARDRPDEPESLNRMARGFEQPSGEGPPGWLARVTF